MKILVIQQKMIGDVLTSTILFPILRQSYPNAELHYLIDAHTTPVVKNHPNIDKHIVYTPEIKDSSILFYSFLKAIRKENYDIVVDVYGKWSSNFITLFSGANTKIGYYKWYTQFFYNIPVKRLKQSKNNQGLAIENRLQLLDPICKTSSEVKPKIYLSAKEIKDAKTFLINFKIDLSQPLFMISVLGSDGSKTYPFSYMSNIVDMVVEYTNGNILFNYIPKQKEDAKAIFNLCKPETQARIHFNVFGKSLREFVAITHHCNALIGNEGGAINISKAINIPTFAIFSPWIDKDTWNIFEDENTSISVHLKDYKPELFKNKSNKQIKKQVVSYYTEFKPEFFSEKIKSFLNNLIG
ncbi:glycosyltransferase family 9 protein [Hyunsoonleella ulvae]|uniref:glycosyltransferase family 9 protein n=1 Tax=Hyunsoonleella ulvae TaxID=2799948 RepID=UPI00193963DF|nr:glycosyltransferase family 9 protein [Hyunsoonleella ulvae]